FRTMRYANDTGSIKVISYGGRGVAWKGFLEMARAMALTRSRLSDRTIEWLVFGDAILPPDNPIAPYIPLGFLKPEALCQAYNKADILLSASWYESFPLFPVEAMACGLAVITTQAGTEDYAFHAETAHIVESRNVESIADGLCKLIVDIDYRNNLASNGEVMAARFTWESSVDTMEKILTEIATRDC
uniref:glycosyltransferase family 4 protein n=1 Tax=Geobacter sp. TaxID=46610 RepID=UPI00261C75C6